MVFSLHTDGDEARRDVIQRNLDLLSDLHEALDEGLQPLIWEAPHVAQSHDISSNIQPHQKGLAIFNKKDLAMAIKVPRGIFRICVV